jgi:hypothetical protein
MSTISTVYFSPHSSSGAYPAQLTECVSTLNQCLPEIVTISHAQWTRMVITAIDIIIPLMPVNIINRAEQTDLTVVEKMCRASRNVFGKIAEINTYQPTKYLYTNLSRACALVFTSIHNSRIKISYNTTEYVINPDGYVSRIRVSNQAAQACDRLAADPLAVSENTDQVIASLVAGISFTGN